MKFIKNYIEDLLIVIGLLILIGTTLYLSVIIGLYCLGATILLLGVYFSKFPPGGGKG